MLYTNQDIRGKCVMLYTNQDIMHKCFMLYTNKDNKGNVLCFTQIKT